MKSAIEVLAARLTARKGNHPLLWIVFGAAALFASVASVFDGATVVALPRIWRALQGFSGSRFREVAFAEEPLVFLAWVLATFLFGAFCLSIGSTALVLRSKARKNPHPLASIVTK